MASEHSIMFNGNFKLFKNFQGDIYVYICMSIYLKKYKWNSGSVWDFNPVKFMNCYRKKEQLEEMMNFQTDAYSHAITEEISPS